MPSLDGQKTEIHKHINDRFTALGELLSNPQKKVVIAGVNDIGDDAGQETADGAITGTHYQGAKGHRLGAGLAHDQWTGNDAQADWLETEWLFDTKVKALFDGYPDQVSCGAIPDKDGRDQNPDAIYVWGANSGNWNVNEGETFEAGGQDQVVGSEARDASTFGIVSTPLAYDITKLQEDDKCDYRSGSFTAVTASNSFALGQTSIIQEFTKEHFPAGDIPEGFTVDQIITPPTEDATIAGNYFLQKASNLVSGITQADPAFFTSEEKGEANKDFFNKAIEQARESGLDPLSKNGGRENFEKFLGDFKGKYEDDHTDKGQKIKTVLDQSQLELEQDEEAAMAEFDRFDNSDLEEEEKRKRKGGASGDCESTVGDDTEKGEEKKPKKKDENEFGASDGVHGAIAIGLCCVPGVGFILAAATVAVWLHNRTASHDRKGDAAEIEKLKAQIRDGMETAYDERVAEGRVNPLDFDPNDFDPNDFGPNPQLTAAAKDPSSMFDGGGNMLEAGQVVAHESFKQLNVGRESLEAAQDHLNETVTVNTDLADVTTLSSQESNTATDPLDNAHQGETPEQAQARRTQVSADTIAALKMQQQEGGREAAFAKFDAASGNGTGAGTEQPKTQPKAPIIAHRAVEEVKSQNTTSNSKLGKHAAAVLAGKEGGQRR